MYPQICCIVDFSKEKVIDQFPMEKLNENNKTLLGWTDGLAHRLYKMDLLDGDLN